jgi:hypothetical protein
VTLTEEAKGEKAMTGQASARGAQAGRIEDEPGGGRGGRGRWLSINDACRYLGVDQSAEAVE